MSVTAIIVTRGDVDLTDIIHSFFNEWEIIVWDNGVGHVRVYPPHDGPSLGTRLIDSKRLAPAEDLSVYGRYAAIEHASNDLIYVQDDDCIVRDPSLLVSAWKDADANGWTEGPGEPWGGVVCNMPPEFRHDFYTHHALVGFGAAFHRDAPARAFARMWDGLGAAKPWLADMARSTPTLERAARLAVDPKNWPEHFLRTCDVVFTGLTPRVLVHVPKVDLPYAHDETRMWRQPEHQAERARMLDLVRKIA